MLKRQFVKLSMKLLLLLLLVLMHFLHVQPFSSLPPVVGYDGPQRRRFPGNGQVARRFGHRQGRQDQLNNGYLQEFVPSENYQYQKYNNYQVILNEMTFNYCSFFNDFILQTHRVRRNEGPLNSTDGLVQTSSSIRFVRNHDNHIRIQSQPFCFI